MQHVDLEPFCIFHLHAYKIIIEFIFENYDYNWNKLDKYASYLSPFLFGSPDATK